MTTEEEQNDLPAEIPKSGAELEDEVVKKPVVTVVVLGDIGHSPRMCNHAVSLAQEGFYVHIVGYGGSALPNVIKENRSIQVSCMKEPPKLFQDFPRLIQYPAKIVWQWVFLSWVFLWVTLLYGLIPNFILIQNPPAIPTLPLAWLYSKIYGCPLVVDWHNYGYTLMALNLGRKHRITMLYEMCEMYFGAKGTHHLCVSRAMKDDLKRRIGVDAIAFHDRPPERFKSLTHSERIAFLTKFADQYPSLLQVTNSESTDERPGILVSTTSWTEDENFGILLTALTEYDKIQREDPVSYPKLIVFITGKGPQKEYYRRLIEKLNLKRIEIHLPWLEPEDYPKLLGCADLGVSLHTSSSGLDLPMKVVDMFGCGLPVAAIHFPCISELVQHMYNGLIFNTSSELAQQIQEWFSFKPTIINKNRIQPSLRGMLGSSKALAELVSVKV
ncbi:unnamed protein product [Allacma fusca]|uniref:Beta-1,4-mannosyltransferase n=1 Tax=Allacma fusca TaxID=39272 RepID=A0A8J2JG75_9HEXA|nr:unnamed protein product [Allacma fusca]